MVHFEHFKKDDEIERARDVVHNLIKSQKVNHWFDQWTQKV